MATNKRMGANARKDAVKEKSEEDAGQRDRRYAAREAGLTKLGGKSGVRKDALVTLIDTNQSLREEAVSLMLDIAILRERR